MSEDNGKVDEQDQSQQVEIDGVDVVDRKIDEADNGSKVDSIEEVNQILEDVDGSFSSGVSARVDELEELLSQANDRALRAQAETMNTIRRAKQDVEKAHKFALDKFVSELIPVVESLEKGIGSAEQAQGDYDILLEGMRLIEKQFLDALYKFKVEQVNPVGEPFDPNFHQAISMVSNPDVEPNTVMEVFQKGYTLHGRVVRPAMVVVSSGASE